MVSGLDDGPLDSLTSFGHHLGMCFQVVDDVLDVTRSEAELGKPAGNDIHEGVYTLPVIRAMKSSPELRGMLGHALESADVALARDLVARDEVIETCLAVAREHAERAATALREAHDLDAVVTARLATLVDDLVDRSS